MSDDASDSGVRGAKLYVDLRLNETGRPGAIASQPVARWFGEWTGDVRTKVDEVVSSATEKHALAQLVAYDIPGRDGGGYSAGGAGSSAVYRAWIDEFAVGIGRRQAIVILEPDALAQLQTLSNTDQTTRLADLAYATEKLATQTGAIIYIDAGHSAWHDVGTMARRLQQANVERARGFALNVSNFQRTEATVAYGDALARELGGKHYVIDTGRNGQGPQPDAGERWINPYGRGLGVRPTTNPEIGRYADAFLWIKTPGESDGTANGGPPAGEWFEAYAQMLIANAEPDS
jgi:endoglucanase